MELTLLQCGIMICLGGVMFQGIPEGMEEYYATHIWGVTIMVLGVLFFSLLFWMGVIGSEILGYGCERMKRWLGDENFIHQCAGGACARAALVSPLPAKRPWGPGGASPTHFVCASDSMETNTRTRRPTA